MNSQNSTSILVVGATGFLGMEICRQLIEEGKTVKGLVRATSEPARVDFLKNIGVQTIEGDMKDKASIDRACQGVGAIISTASSTLSRQPGDSIQTVDLEGQLNVVKAAEDEGVSHFVLLSFPEISREFPLQDAKRIVEKRLSEGKMIYTILQPSMFMEVWLSPALGFDYPHAKATVYGEGNKKVSWIAIKDVAQFAVASLENPAARNAVIQLGGPEGLTSLEVVQLFEEQGGREFIVNHVPVEALQAQKAAATDPLQQSFAALMLSFAEGLYVDMQQTLQQFPLQLTSVKEYAQNVTPAQAAATT